MLEEKKAIELNDEDLEKVSGGDDSNYDCYDFFSEENCKNCGQASLACGETDKGNYYYICMNHGDKVFISSNKYTLVSMPRKVESEIVQDPR